MMMYTSFLFLSVDGRPAQQDDQHGRHAEGGGEQPVQLPAQHVLGRGHRRGGHDQQAPQHRVRMSKDKGTSPSGEIGRRLGEVLS